MFYGRILVVASLLFSPNINSASAQNEPTVEVGKDSLAAMLEALIIKNGVDIMKGNIEAARRESGELDKAVRAVLGISIRDIKRYGLLGGPNSEMRKLFQALGISERLED